MSQSQPTGPTPDALRNVPQDPPPPPGGPKEHHRSERRRTLTVPSIVAATLNLVTSRGMAAVSMRTVAGELGVAASSLYPHVGSRERLLDLAVRDVLGGIAPVESTGDWRADLRQHFVQVHDRLSAHADLVQHAFFSAVSPTRAEDLRDVEALLARLTREGLPAGRVLAAYDRLMLITVADVYAAWQRRQRVDDAEVTAWLSSFDAYRAQVLDDDFPHLGAHARELVAPDPQERFLAGLDLLLDGLAAPSAGRLSPT